MKKNLLRITLLFCFISLFMGRETFAADQQTITSGDWKIVYNNDTKTCDFIHKGKTILAGVFVQAKDKDQLLRSTEYGQPTFSEEAVDDVFGAGHKYTFTYAGQEGAPSLQQLFYFYPDKSYFLTEAFILSEAGTSSNYIAPVVTETVNSFLNTNTSNRVLSVPFLPGLVGRLRIVRSYFFLLWRYPRRAGSRLGRTRYLEDRSPLFHFRQPEGKPSRMLWRHKPSRDPRYRCYRSKSSRQHFRH